MPSLLWASTRRSGDDVVGMFAVPVQSVDADGDFHVAVFLAPRGMTDRYFFAVTPRIGALRGRGDRHRGCGRYGGGGRGCSIHRRRDRGRQRNGWRTN